MNSITEKQYTALEKQLDDLFSIGLLHKKYEICDLLKTYDVKIALRYFQSHVPEWLLIYRTIRLDIIHSADRNNIFTERGFDYAEAVMKPIILKGEYLSAEEKKSQTDALETCVDWKEFLMSGKKLKKAERDQLYEEGWAKILPVIYSTHRVVAEAFFQKHYSYWSYIHCRLGFNLTDEFDKRWCLAHEDNYYDFRDTIKPPYDN
jgi:hypothetical protein